MSWERILKQDATASLLEIILPDLQTSIPYSIDTMTFMKKRLAMPIDKKSIREDFQRVWRDGKKAITMDVDWTRKFLGDGYTLDEVNWYTVNKKVMDIVDNVLDGM